MRALTRMRTLAAACALLLFVSGMAAAGRPGLPIDKTGQPENPQPPMVGDPDQPPNLPLLIGGHVFLVRVPAGMARPVIRLLTARGSRSTSESTLRGARHAR